MIHAMTDPARPASPPGPRNLSSIPPLPPIEIPRPTFVSSKHDPSSALSTMDSDDPAPSSAHLSEESYATAYTSPFPVTAGESYKDDIAVNPFKAFERSTHQGSPGVRGLAKSMSVDSFIKERRVEQIPFELDNSTRSVSPADSVSTSLRTIGPSSQHRLSAGDSEMDHGQVGQYEPGSSSAHTFPPSTPPASKLPDLPSTLPSLGRADTTVHRTNSQRMSRVTSLGGRSFAPMAEDDPDSSPEDSDFEPQISGRSPLTQTRDDLRKKALGPKRSGSLPSSSPLPTKLMIPNRNSRILASGILGSHTNVTTKNLPIRGSYAPRPPPVHAPPLKNKLSMPASFEPTSPSQQSRLRSQSIGEKSTSGGPHDGNFLRADLSVDTRNLQVPNARELTFAVVGAAGCGKSTFIRKSLKQNGVSAGEVFSVRLSDGDGQRSIEYIERRSYVTALFDIPGSKDRVERPFNVTFLEINVESLLSELGELRDKGWPKCLPMVDGIFICYNASERASFTHVGGLLSGYDSLSIPSMVLACKSDLDKRISPSDALSIIQKFAGLVEVSSQTESGKKKMRRSLDLFIKMLEKSKSDPKDKENGYRNPVSPDALHPPPSPWNSALLSHNRESMQSTAVHIMGNGQLTSPSSAENTHPPSPYPISSRSPNKSPLPRTETASNSSPPSPTRSRSLSDLLSDSHRVVKPTRSHLSHVPVQDLHLLDSGVNHLPLDRNRTRSIADIAQEDALAVKLSNAPADQSSLLPDSLALPRDKSDENLQDITPLASPPTELVKSLEQSESDSYIHVDAKKDTNLDPEQEFERNRDAEEPILIMNNKSRPKDPPPNPYATLDELLDKLFFVAVSGDDPSFITHFFLTFRRFATARSVLLAMQRRMLELSKDTGDVTMASYAQMRICNLLEQWINEYPSDFATPGAPGALTALVKQVLRQSHTLYYGSDFLPFLERLPTLVDEDGAWALKVPDASLALSDESDNSTSEDLDEAVAEAINAGDALAEGPEDSPDSAGSPSRMLDLTSRAGRERKASMPLSAKAFLPRPAVNPAPLSQKDLLARLVRTANTLSHFDPEVIAQEITRRELELYLQIEPRDWIRHTLVSGKKDPQYDKIARLNNAYNDLHEWAVSLILCHDKIRQRAKQIEKFAEVAIRLRNMNNYSGLRAIVTAVHQSTYPGDEVMELFKQKTDLHKKFLSSDILLRTSGAHRSYRLALRNTRGPCIPCIEVHTSDMRRAHEGNPDIKADDPSKVHWAKFDMLGKFITATTQYQRQCLGPNGYKLHENPALRQLFEVPVMDYDMQQSRMYPPPDEGDIYSTPLPPSMALDHTTHGREANVIKRLFFWS